MLINYKTMLFAGGIMCCLFIQAQGIDTLANHYSKLAAYPKNLSTDLEKNYNKIDKNIEADGEKILKQMHRQEALLQKRLAKMDSTKAKQLMVNSEAYYSGLEKKLKSKTNNLNNIKEYFPKLDSLGSAAKFLQKGESQLKGISKIDADNLGRLSEAAGNMQNSLQNSMDVKKLLTERRQQLQDALQQYDLGKYFSKMNKGIYYYQERLNVYKATLKDKKKMEDKVISYVRGLPAFKQFMAKNSLLAKLFPTSAGGITDAPGLIGLQTRSLVQNGINSQLGGGSGSQNPQQLISQQVDAAKQQMGQLKDKVNKLSGNSSNVEMPDFSPNRQKTKSFLQRLEYGFNIQSQKTTSFLPTTSDLALTAGYKLNDKSTIGLGASYKLGWGNNGLKNIKLSNEGIGLRSFMDFKIKGNFWISGGYEKNYLPTLAQKGEALSIEALRGKKWESSGLLGITKKYKIGKRMGNMQLLWDFLSYSQIPRSQAIKFRTGLNF